MPKRSGPPDGSDHPAGSNTGWSVGSSQLTASGRLALLKHLGRQLQADYEPVIEELPPGRLRKLLKRLEGEVDQDEDDG